MDIVLAVFLFGIGTIFALIGFPTHGEKNYKSVFFLILAALFFFGLAFGLFIDPVKVVSGTGTFQNVTGNITVSNTTVFYTPLQPELNGMFSLIFLFMGIFLFFSAFFSGMES